MNREGSVVKKNQYEELRMAAMLRKAEDMRKLVRAGANINQVGSHGTILSCVTWYNDLELVRTLLELGAKPNLNNGDALLNSVSSPNQNKDTAEVVRLLAGAGADINRVYKVQSEIPEATPLMIAIFFGYAKVADTLIESGADIHFTSAKGQSAFSLAADQNLLKIGQKLIDRGYKPNPKNKYLQKFARSLKKPGAKLNNYLEEKLYLVPSRSVTAHSTGNPDLKKLMGESHLPLCPNPAVHLLTLDLREISALPANIRKIGKLHVPFYCCSDCNGEPDALDFQIGKNGRLKLLTNIKGKKQSCEPESAGTKTKTSYLKVLKKEPEERCGIYLGGEPNWWQYPAWPSCPECGLNGFYIGQISQSLVPPGHGGPDNGLFIFVCGDCRTQMLVRQMT